MNRLTDQLSQLLPELSTKLAIAARYALDRPDQIAMNSMRTVASDCGVASPTMLRLARKMGFSNYLTFKAAFQNELVGQGFENRANALKLSSQPGDQVGMLALLETAAINNVSQAFSDCDLDVLKKMANVMLSANTTYLVGSGSAHWLAAFMQATGRMALPELRAPRSGDASMIEILGNIRPNDAILAFGFSPFAKRTLDVLKFASKRDVTIMTITDLRSSPLIEYSELTLIAPSRSPHFFPSMISTMAMIEVLLATVVAESGPETLKKIARIEELRENIGEYLW